MSRGLDERLAKLSPEQRRLLELAMKKKGMRGPASRGIGQRPDPESAPLTWDQENLWFIDQMNPGHPVYNINSCWHLVGRLDLRAVRRAVAEMVRRHETLRTTYERRDGEARQIIHPSFEVVVPVVDLAALPEDRRFPEGLRAREFLANRSFDLHQGPMIRVTATRMDPESWMLLSSIHHISSDWVSFAIYGQELGELYAAFSRGEPSPLKPLPIQLGDYAHWQRQYLQGETLERLDAFWTQHFEGSSFTLQLSTDRPRPAVPTFEGGRRYFHMPLPLREGVQELARRENASGNMLYLGLFSLLLHFYSGQRDIVIGAPNANRDRDEVKGLIGFLLNMMAVRVQVRGGESFRQLLAQSKETSLGVFAHQEMPFGRLVRLLEPPRDPSRNPVFQASLVYLDFGDTGTQNFGELEKKPLIIGPRGSRFDLTLAVMEEATGKYEWFWEYSSDLWDQSSIDRMQAHLASLMRGVVEHPDRPMAELSLLSSVERHQMLWEWGTLSASPQDGCLHGLVARWGHNTPDALALVQDDEEWTYGELLAEAHALAGRLQAAGIGLEDRVGVHAERSPRMVLGQLAVLLAGAAYVPLDPSLPPARRGHIAADAGLALLLSTLEEPTMEAMPPVWSIERGQAGEAPAVEREIPPEAMAYVIYTSGSTGTPKGVAVHHRGVVGLMHWHHSAYGLISGERSSQIAGPGFDASVWEIWSALAHGATLVFAPQEARTDVGELRRFLVNQAIDVAFVPTPLAESLVREPPPEELALRSLLTGGDRLHLGAGGWPLFNHYGPTECTVVSSAGRVPETPSSLLPTIGRPLVGQRVEVLNHRLLPLPALVAGELVIGGPGVARGYLGRPAATAEVFVPDPRGESGSRMYKSGDHVRFLPNGEIDFIGRLDQQVKVRGFRIELGEIEAVLDEHAGVAECVVVPRREGETTQLVAWVVPKDTSSTDSPEPMDEALAAELKAHLGERLPLYMVPTHYGRLHTLPLLPTGKVNRRHLESLAPPTSSHEAAQILAPRNPREETLAAIWAEVLRREQIGVEDNFFELGGDSILAIQVTSRANRAGIRLGPNQLFTHPTVAQLAALAGDDDEAPAVVDVKPVTGAVPLTPIQHWFFEQGLGQPHHFNLAMQVQVRQALPLEGWRELTRRLLHHHDALRLRFRRTAVGWQQVNAGPEDSPTGVPFTYVDLSRLGAATAEDARQKAAHRLQASLDLARGPLVRLTLFRDGIGPQRLLLVAHHLVVDWVSWGILLEDLAGLHQQIRDDAPTSLPAKTTSFQHWANTLVEVAATPERSAEAAWWLEGTADLPEAARQPLPPDFPGGANTLAHADQVNIALDAERTTALLERVPSVYGTRIQEILLTALALATAELSGEPQLLVDLEGHGREAVAEGLDLSRTVGWMTSLYPFRLDLRNTEGPGEQIRTVKEQLRALPNRGIGHGLLRYLGADFETSLALGDAPRATLSWNYLGRFDGATTEAPLRPLPQAAAGPNRSRRDPRQYELDVTGLVVEGQLKTSWLFSQVLHRKESVEKLAEAFLEALKRLIDHCLTPGSGGRSPSDFPLADLDLGQVDRLEEAHDPDDVYPLSPLQQGLYFHALEPQRGEYVVHLVAELEGDLDPKALRGAWRALLHRHPILRTAFEGEIARNPLQVVERAPPLPFLEVDLSALPEVRRGPALEALLLRDRYTGFDLTRAPVMRMVLLRLKRQSSQLLWSYHHILLDGWSLPPVLGDLFRLYAGHTLAPAVPFRRYLEWMKAQDPEEASTFWRSHLAGLKEPLRLDLGRPQAVTGPGQHDLFLESATGQTIEEAARRRRLPLATLASAAWALCLARLTGRRDVVFGTTVSGRPPELEGVESMVGLLINTLPLRLEMPTNESLGTWLENLQSLQNERRRFEHTPLLEVQGLSEIPRGEALFDTLMAVENYPVDGAPSEVSTGLKVRFTRSEERTHFPLTLAVVPRQRLQLRIMVDPQRFDPPTAQRVLRLYRTLLEDLATSPDERALGSFDGLTHSQRHQLLREWNDSAEAVVEETLLHRAVTRWSTTHADAIALFDSRHLSYGELVRRARYLAYTLHQHGIRAEEVVAVLLAPGLEMVTAWLGVLEAGATYLPLDPAYPEARIAFLLEDSGAPVLLAEEPPAGLDVPVLSLPETPPEESPQYEARAHPEQLAYLVYTSGSTGRPKGVMVSHRNVSAFVAWSRDTLGLEPGNRSSRLASPAFDATVFETWPTLTAGGTLDLIPREKALDVEALTLYLDRHRLTHAFAPTPLAEELLRRPSFPPTVRYLSLGGDRLRHNKPHTFCPQVLNLYGPTEATVVTTSAVVPTGTSNGDLPTIGRPLRGWSVKILGPEGQPVPQGAPGELVIGGIGLSRGYLGRPARTAQSFVPDPFSDEPGARLYKSGDLARHDAQGQIHFLGRRDHQVKVRGVRIELGEIEAALAGLDSLQEAVVLPRTRSGATQLVCWYVPAQDTSTEELAQALRQELPEALVPSLFAPLDALPRDAHGKIDRKTLQGLELPGDAPPSIAPRTPLEAALANLWAEVLEREAVDLFDDFFELGGHSLLAARLVSRVRRDLSLELSVATLFEHRTVAAIAERLEDAKRSTSLPPLKPRTDTGPAPLSFAQERLWFLARLVDAPTAYNVPIAWTLKGPLVAQALHTALSEITHRHHVLRTRFPLAGEAPVQVVDHDWELPLPRINLEGLDLALAHNEAQRLAAIEFATSFDLEHGPVVRGLLLRLAPEEHVLLFTQHHIVTDGASIPVFLAELQTFYNDFVRTPRKGLRGRSTDCLSWAGARRVGGGGGPGEGGVPTGFEPGRAGTARRSPFLGVRTKSSSDPEVQYADFAIWQRSWLRGKVLDEQIQFWRQRLADRPALELPLDRPRPAIQTFRGARVEIPLQTEATTELETLARRAGASPFMAYLTVFHLLLSRQGNAHSSMVGTPVANRRVPELEGLIGFFVNSLAMVADLGDDPSFATLLPRVRDEALAAFEHQDLPFEKLVAELAPERDLSRNPLFQVMLTLDTTTATTVRLGELEVERLPFNLRSNRFDLELLLGRRDNTLHLALFYDSSLFDTTTAQRLTRSYRRLLEAVATTPHASAGTLPMLERGEQHQLLVEWNDTAPQATPNLGLHGMVRHWAQQTPEGIALVGKGESLTFAEVVQLARGLAERLHDLGIQPEDLVALHLDRTPALAWAALGVLEAGASYLPLDPAHPEERRAALLVDAAPKVLLTLGSPSQALTQGDWTPLDLAAVKPTDSPLPPPTEDFPKLRRAYVIYTSGSTGKPKGVEVSHGGLAHLVRWHRRRYHLGPGVHTSQVAAPGFDASVWEIWAALTSGATLHFLPDAARASAPDLLRALAEAQIEVAFLPTPLAEAILREEPPANLELRALLTGGDRLAALESPPVIPLFNHYGPTENSVVATAGPWHQAGEDPDLGRPLPGTSLYIFDALLRPLPRGAAGELCLAGEGLARGYLGRPATTAERFVPNPTHGAFGARLYRTGDRGNLLPDGRLRFLGRVDRQLKVRGVRLEPGEIEAVLRTHPEVEQAVVVGVQDPLGGQRLAAFVTGDSTPEAALRSWLTERLPQALVPDTIENLETLPLTANQKVDRKRLVERARRPVADPATPSVAALTKRPMDDLEQRIAAVWREVLDREEVGPEENFFDLGGHSLLMVRLEQRLRHALGREVPVVELFRFPTVRSLARHLSEGEQPLELPTTPGRSADSTALAVVGFAGRFPGASDVDAFWKLLEEGREGLSRFDRQELLDEGLPAELVDDPNYVPAWGEAEGIDLFDADFFDMTPREAQILDPQQRIFLEVAWQALETAGVDPRREPSVGVFAGVGFNRWLRRVEARQDLVRSVGDYPMVLSNQGDFLPTRLSYKLDLEGPSVNVQTACSTSLVAVHLAARSLRDRECRVALAGGTSFALGKQGYLYQKGGILSPDGHCRAFDEAAAGCVAGSGAAVVVLKRLDDALADGDTIRAVLRGSAINNDGAAKAGFTAPGVEGQAKAVRAALADAGMEPGSIGYIEAHGTGTELGDPIEVAALGRAFESAGPGFRCRLGSVKTNVGHLDAAAGVTGLIKAVLALEHETLPASLHYERANPKTGLTGGPFEVVRETTPWPRNETPRRAGVSSFGLGGTNAHVVLEEAPLQLPGSRRREAQLLLLSARKPEALEPLAQRLAQHLESSSATLADTAHTLQLGRRFFPHRRALVVTKKKEAIKALRAEGTSLEVDPAVRPRVAFLLSGQGSQHPGMGLELYQQEPIYRQTFDRCTEVLHDELGQDLRQVLAECDADELARTALAQPALFALEVSLARQWMHWGVVPDALLGHSLGEFSAAHLAGIFSLEDALRLVALRGRLMERQPSGAMLALALPEEEVLDLLSQQEGVELAAVNGPRSTVVSGPEPAVAALRASLDGIPTRRLVTSHAFHSVMMEPVLEPFRAALETVEAQAPKLPILSNRTGTWLTPEQATDPGYWLEQLRHPVRFADGAARLAEDPGRILLEVGPGRALAQQARRSGALDRRRILHSLPHAQAEAAEGQWLLETLGGLWSLGVEVDWSAFAEAEDRRKIPLPTYPFDRRRHWIDPPTAKAADTTTPLRKRSDLASWFYLPAWSPSLPPPAGTGGGPWLLLADEHGTAEALATQLRAEGESVHVALPGEGFQTQNHTSRLHFATAEGWQHLVDHLLEQGQAPRTVVHLACFGNAAGTSWPMGYAAGLHLMRALLERRLDDGLRWILAADALYAVLPGEKVRPWKAAALGPLRVLPQEHPGLLTLAVDLDPNEESSTLVHHLLTEARALGQGESAAAVGWRRGQRLVRTFTPTPIAAGATEGIPREGGVYLITGGLGRVGLRIAEHLAEHHHARLALLGRSPLPPRDGWTARIEEGRGDALEKRLKRLLALETQGAEILPLTGDVANEASLQHALDQVHERFGTLHGVIHAAAALGGPADGLGVPLARLDLETSERQLHPKARGLEVLHRALDGRELEVRWIVSSLAAELGGLGFGAYAAANAFQDAFAHAHPGWQSIAWDGWPTDEEDGSTPVGRATLDLAMNEAESGDALARLLGRSLPPHLLVSTADLHQRLDRWVHRSPDKSSIAEDAPRTAGPAPPLGGEEGALVALFQEILGLPSVASEDDFFELGGDSMLGTQLMANLRRRFEVDLPLDALFAAPTPAGLAERIQSARGSSSFEAESRPVRRVGDRTTAPLSFSQQRLWFLDRLLPGSAQYNLVLRYRLRGPLDQRALERSLARIVERHEVLRTRFVGDGGEAQQEILPRWVPILRRVDLGALPSDPREQKLNHHLDTELLRPFDLSQVPLLRPLLLRLGEEDHVVQLVMHHIVSDGVSMAILQQELETFYRAETTGEAVDLPKLEVQYADFAAWQRKHLVGEKLEEQLDYWRGQLRGAEELRLPMDRPPKALEHLSGAGQGWRLERPVFERLNTLSRHSGTTLFITLLAAFQTLLYRLTGQTDVVLGSPIAGRNVAETEGLIGFFVNTLVLRTELEGSESFHQLLERTRTLQLEAHAHQDLPFEKLVEELAPERSLVRNPFFQVMFALQNIGVSRLRLQGLETEPLEVPAATVRTDLEVHLSETPNGLEGTLAYATDFFDTTTIQRLGRSLQRLLSAIVHAPERALAELPILSQAERQQLREWNDTNVAPPEDQLLHQRILRGAAEHPDRPAAVGESETLSYGELARGALQVASHLRALGVGPEDRVGLLMERSPGLVVAALAVLEAGAAYLPLDPNYPTERLAFLLEDAEPKVVLAATVPDPLPDDGPKILTLADLLARNAPPVESPKIHSEHPAYVVYTSGSTGRPKGVVVPHGGLRNLGAWLARAAPFEPGERHSQALNPSFDAWAIDVWPLLSGGTTLVLPAEEARYSGEAMADWLERERIESAFLPTALMEALLTEPRPLPQSLRQMFTGGEKLHLKAIEGLEAPLFNCYGPTEASVACTFLILSPTSAKRLTGDPTIGRPLDNLRLWLLGPHFVPASPGTSGELCIAGPGLARGYLGRPALSAERFVPDPLANHPGERLYRTGDLGRFDTQGRIEFLGRIDTQVKVRGFRIEPGEIEAVLGEHEAVGRVVVHPHAEAPGGGLVAFFTSPGAPPRADALRELLVGRLPDFMVPALFHPMEELPLTPNGKVDRRALDALELTLERGTDYAVPRDPMEELLAEVWARVLGREVVGVHDNFFDLGGHSLLATQAVARAGEVFDREIPLRELFEHPTVAELAVRLRHIDAEDEEATPTPPPLEALPRTEVPAEFIASFSQLREWILDRFDPGSAAYNMPAPVRLQGPLHIGALHAALNALVKRHESLRTHFRGTLEDEPVQIVRAAAPHPLPLLDLSTLPDALRQRESLARAQWEAALPFDLSHGPLFRTLLVRLDPNEHLLLTTFHHIVSDGWSLGVYFRELDELYRAFTAEPARTARDVLPPLDLQYADFAAWQRDWLEGEVIEHFVGWWRRQLAGAPTVLELPADRPRTAVRSTAGALTVLPLEPPLVAALRGTARKSHASLFMVLLAGLDAWLLRTTGEADLVVGTFIANRNRAATADLLGFFVNTLPLRVDLGGQPSSEEAIHRARQSALAAFAHQDLPFEKLLDALDLERDPSHTPLFQVLLTLQNIPDLDPNLGDLTVSHLGGGLPKADFDLEFTCHPSGEGLAAQLKYSRQLFDATTAHRFLRQWRTLLQGLVDHPQAPLAALSLHSQAERHQMLREWNDTAPASPETHSVIERIKEQAAQTPQAPAVLAADGEFTYAELEARSRTLAHSLVQQGVGPETVVAVSLPRCRDLPAVLLGVLRAGGAYLPLDPEYPQERLTFLLEDSRAALLVVRGGDPDDDGPQALVELAKSRELPVLPLAQLPGGNDSPQSLPTPSSDQLAYVLYTSGSTGTPKGVAVSHGALARFTQTARQLYQITAEDRVLQFAALGFDTHVEEIFPTLASGAVLALRPQGKVQAPSDFLADVENRKLTVLDLPTAYWHELMRTLDGPLPPSVRLVILGGEKASDTARDTWFRKVPGTLSNKVSGTLLSNKVPGTLLMNTYGPTETTVIASAAVVEASGEIPIGQPLVGVRTHLVDAALRTVPAGGQGEITIAGAGLARGYLGRARLTAERFVPNPFATQPGARLYKTGDLGRYRRDGALLFRGRVDDQVKLRGLRVEPGEIAAVLAQHPNVEQAEVVYRPLPSGNPGLAAFVVPRADAPTVDTLRTFLRDSLPPFMVPAAFSMLDELPKTPANKVDRRALTRLPLHLETSTTTEAPQGQLESRLATLWAEVLGLPRLGVTDNFFDLGGDSLLILRLHRRLEEEGFRLQVLDLFRHTTVRALATHLGATEEKKPDFKGARKLVEQQKKARQRRRKRRPRPRGR